MHPNPKFNLVRRVCLLKMHPYQQCSPTQSAPPPKISPNPKGTPTKSASSNRNHNKIRWLQKIFFAFCSRGCRIHFSFLQPRLQNSFFISAASGCRISKRLQNLERLQKNRPRLNTIYSAWNENLRHFCVLQTTLFVSIPGHRSLFWTSVSPCMHFLFISWAPLSQVFEHLPSFAHSVQCAITTCYSNLF